MKLSDRTYVIFLFIIIFTLGFLSLKQFKNFNKPIGDTPPIINFPEVNPEEDIFAEIEREVVWVSPDKKLQLTYSIEWLNFTDFILGETDPLSLMVEEAELLLFAQKVLIQSTSGAFLSINKFSEVKPITVIAEEIEERAEEEATVEIKFWEEDGTTWLELFTEYPDEPKTYSMTKVIYTVDATYLVAFSVKHSDWSMIQREAEEIFDSIKTITEEA